MLEMSRGKARHPALASISSILWVYFSMLDGEKTLKQAPDVAEVVDPSRIFFFKA